MVIIDKAAEKKRIDILIGEICSEEIIFKEIMSSLKTYDKTFTRLYDYLKRGFEHKEVRECLVKFKIKPTGEWLYMQLRHMATNMIFWRAVIGFDGVESFDESYIIDCFELTKKSIKTFIDDKLIKPFFKNVKKTEANRLISEIIYGLSCIGSDFGEILAMSISIETFIDLAQRFPRFRELTTSKIPDNLQMTEIEELLAEMKQEYVSIILNDPEYNHLKPLIASGGGIKIDQLAEVGILGGLKPDLYGNTIPIVINSNFIYGGLTNLIHYYIDSIAGRKGLILNKTVMGTSGWYARMLGILSTSVTLSDDHDCDTITPIEMFVRDKKILARLVGRNYYSESGEMKMLDGSEKELIGKVIRVRSPITCTSKTGVCKTCYGHMYDMNRDINIGGFAATKISRKISQDILSTKHLLKTRSVKIDFPKEFYNFFNIRGDEIYLREDVIEDLDNWRIKLPESAFDPDEEYEGEGVIYSTHMFIMENIVTGEKFEFSEENDTKLVINEDFFKLITQSGNKRRRRRKSSTVVNTTALEDDNQRPTSTSMASLEDEMVVFMFEITNNELTKPLYDIISLTNKIHRGGCETISEMAQRLLELMIEADIELLSVHGEVVLKMLVRAKDNPLDFPDFSTDGPEAEYQILTMIDALIRNRSVTISLATQNLKRQLMSPLTFLKRETSYMDQYFKLQ